jgi:hypothetical protein
MQPPDTTDAPIVPPVSTDSETDSGAPLASDGGRPSSRPFDRPPRTDYATEYTRDEEEIEPLVADLR